MPENEASARARASCPSLAQSTTAPSFSRDLIARSALISLSSARRTRGALARRLPGGRWRRSGLRGPRSSPPRLGQPLEQGSRPTGCHIRVETAALAAESRRSNGDRGRGCGDAGGLAALRCPHGVVAERVSGDHVVPPDTAILASASPGVRRGTRARGSAAGQEGARTAMRDDQDPLAVRSVCPPPLCRRVRRRQPARRPTGGACRPPSSADLAAIPRRCGA